jgi:hypothetical protein
MTDDERSSADPNPVDEFLHYQYKEIKDLCAQFIALLSGILLFSVNFSDKLVNTENAPIYYKYILTSSWSCFILAIIGCSLAMAIAWIAARRMLWGRPSNAMKSSALALSRRAANVIVAAGLIFVLGLILTIMAGFMTTLGGAAGPE